MDNELPLLGGQNTPVVVRIGDTVRRPLSGSWQYRHALLRHLEARTFPFAPRVLGVDERQREILTHLDGTTMIGGEVALQDIGAMIGAFHSATAGSALAAGGEVVCHQDIAPWNTIHQNGQLVGMIDFDGAAPGNRAEHVRHGLQELTFGYGLTNRSGMSEAIHRQQRRILAWRLHLASTATDVHIREMSQDRTVLIIQQIEWVQNHVGLIDGID